MDTATIRQHIVDTHPGTSVLDAGGDLYFVHDPARDLPPERQLPWATIVTSDAHDRASDLDRPGVFRLSIGLPKARFAELWPDGAEHDPTALDVLVPHPVYGPMHWVAVLNPDTTWPAVRDLLARAHALAERKHANASRRRDGA